MIKQYKQIDNCPMKGKPVVNPIDPNTLSSEYKRKVIESVNLIK